MSGMKHRLGVYSIEDIDKVIPSLPVEKPKSTKIIIDGHNVYVDSLRLLCFKKDGYICKSCGLKGSFFAIEQHDNDKSPHLELYAVKDDGTEVIMTRDHIIPRSRGGPNIIENLQAMCEPCNVAKGNKI